MPKFRASAAYRIAVTYAAIYAWTVLLLGAAIYAIAYREFDRQPQQEISAELDRLAHLRSRSELLDELHWRRRSPEANRFTYSLLDEAGKPVRLDTEAPRSSRSGSEAIAERPGGRKVFGNQGSLRFADGGTLIVKHNRPAVEPMKALILQTFAAATAAVFLVSAASALILAWHLRKRLHPISATAAAIASGDLTSRVPVRADGDEFDAAGRTINLMLDRIASLMENLRQVSSDIAHDLRKPLMRLLLQADRLGRVDGAEERLYELGDEMLMLFNGILRIAEVEGGGLERGFQPVDLSSVVTDVVESFAPALIDSEHTIEWDVAPGITVMGNRELLAQLTSNLLDNARIHTPARTTIKLGLTARAGEVRLGVEDDGPGVSDQDRAKLMQRFYRTETSRTTPGNGLGLSLVAAVASAHGGKVEIEDAQPGLRVVVILPEAG